MNQGSNLVEFFCPDCGFQGLIIQASGEPECSKCKGKIITLEREESPNSL